MQTNLPNKTTFIPSPPVNEHEIFRAMQLYPDNAKVYHPHGTIDATSVFWLNKLHPNALNFAAFVDPKASEPLVLSKRILGDIQKLAWKFDVNRIITSDYAPQHTFNQWLTHQGFRLTEKAVQPTLRLSEVTIPEPDKPLDGQLLTAAQLLTQENLWQQIAQSSLSHYQAQHPNNPVANISLNDWQQLLSANLIPQAPVVLLDADNHFESTCFLYQQAKGQAMLNYPAEANNGKLMVLVNAQLHWLKSHYQAVTLSLSSNDHLGLQIYHEFLFENSPVYETYMKIVQH
ncbi:hypothetical protein [Lentilactobacillus kisonensis]|uniref:N-acetyltransferase domain-containing protein n=2 Tax=Lentilactobacillus kisonensis TaxID=481722 RepID=H1LI67_9LACO|nr:hypothetical protein [Lentilactobacillus kisonensis]EHO49900.1 hypothetical protein HMPREF9104_02308 [Lentilactobacillus kisonensis F0435]KRL22137.1 hypothetical protein FC98_GL002754 [Lentilactobacillus kisonensis DSM 19906 = JCM 15041]